MASGVLRARAPSVLSARARRLLSSRALVLNAGSSSLKYGLFDLQTGGGASVLCSGLVDQVGSPTSSVVHKKSGQKTKTE